MATYYINYTLNARWYDASETAISGVGEDTDLTDWDKNSELVLAVNVYTELACNRDPDSTNIRLEYSEDGGSWTPVADTNAIACGSGTTLVDWDTCAQWLTTPPNCSIYNSSHELAGRSPMEALIGIVGKDRFAEMHIAIDPANATAGSTYSFRLYSVTESAPFDGFYSGGVLPITLTIAAVTNESLVIPATGTNDFLIYDDGPITITETEVIHLANMEAYSLLDDNDGEAIALTQVHTLAISDAGESYHLLDDNDGNPVTITQIAAAIDLVIAPDPYHLLASDAPLALTQTHILSADEAYHALADDMPLALSQENSLDVAEAQHDLISDNLSLSGVIDLTVAECYHEQFADSFTITTYWDLVVDEAYHLLTDDTPLGLTALHILAVVECDTLGFADNVELTQLHGIEVAEAAHELTDDAPITLSGAGMIGVDEAYHVVEDEGPLALTATHSLAVDECNSFGFADSIDLAQLHILNVAEAASEIIDTGPLNVSSAANLAGLDAYHEKFADSFALTQEHTLEVAETAHVLASDNLSLAGVASLTVAGADHLHSADNITLSLVFVLTVDEAYHAHVAEAIEVESADVLDAADSYHDQQADTLTLTQLHNLAVNDAYSRLLIDGFAVEHIGESFGVVYRTSIVVLGNRQLVNLTPIRTLGGITNDYYASLQGQG